jgi:hypothetical protein
MAKEYTYTLMSSGKVIYHTVEQNYVSREVVDARVQAETGFDPRLERHLIACSIKMVNEPTDARKIGRIDRNKRMQF